MFKFKRYSGYHLEAQHFFRLGSFWCIPFHFYEGDRDYLDHLLPLQNPRILMNLINIPLFVLAWKLLGKKSLYLSLLGTFSVSAWMAILKLCPSAHYHHFIFTAFKGIFCLPVSLSGVVLSFRSRDHLQCRWNYGRTDILARTSLTIHFPTMGNSC